MLAICGGATRAAAHGPDAVTHGPDRGAHLLVTGWLPASAADVLVLLLLAVTALVYARGVARLWRARGVGHGASAADVACFAGAWTALVVALASPVHALGRVLFAAHMGQHEILMLVAAPLLVLARPLAALLHGLPVALRRAWQRVVRAPGCRRAWRGVTRPLAAWTVHAIALWIWHVPALFEVTLHHASVHAAQHASFFLSALLFWWSVTHAGRSTAAYGAAVLALFTTSLHGGLLGALLTFATTVWYPSYRASAPAFGIDALEDQQLGGLVMWVPAGVLYTIAALALCAGWLRAAERRALTPPAWRAAALALVLCGTLALGACDDRGARDAAAATGGDPERGAVLIRSHGCEACHVIPGIAGARGVVGPPLDGFASRTYIAGRVPNTPHDLIRWLEDPRAIDEHTAMPDVGLTTAEARDVAAYLLTLR